jgi:hypothetical protein
MRRMVSTCAISRTSDGTVTVSPKNESDQSALVVFCHGLGDTSEGFADVAEVRREPVAKRKGQTKKEEWERSPIVALRSS